MNKGKAKQLSMAAQWSGLNDRLLTDLPHLAAVLNDEGDFIEIRIKRQADGTTLGILKRYDSKGGLVVGFGSGYDVAGALMGLNGMCNAGNWKPDKPWEFK